MKRSRRRKAGSGLRGSAPPQCRSLSPFSRSRRPSANGAVRSASSTPGSAPRYRSSAGATAACIHTGAAVIRSPLPCPVAARCTRFRNLLPPDTGSAISCCFCSDYRSYKPTRTSFCPAPGERAVPPRMRTQIGRILNDGIGNRSGLQRDVRTVWKGTASTGKHPGRRRMRRPDDRSGFAGRPGDRRHDIASSFGGCSLPPTLSAGRSTAPDPGGGAASRRAGCSRIDPPPHAVTRPSPWVPLPSSAAANSNGPACKALPPRPPATAAVARRPLRLRVRELSGRIRRAAALLAVATLLGGATMARADVLVSNVGQTQSGSTSMQVWDIAQGFTTGDNLAGYTLGSVEIGMNTGTIGGGDAGKPSAIIFEGGPTGQRVATLIKPNRLSAGTSRVHRYNAPSGTRLSASTTYYVVIEAGTFTSIFALQTNATDEDGTSTEGWSINDRGHSRFASSTGSFSPFGSGKNLRIRVNGTVQATDTTAPALSANITETPATFGISVGRWR